MPSVSLGGSQHNSVFQRLTMKIYKIKAQNKFVCCIEMGDSAPTHLPKAEVSDLFTYMPILFVATKICFLEVDT